MTDHLTTVDIKVLVVQRNQDFLIKRVYTQLGEMIWAWTVDRLQYALTTSYWLINHGERARFVERIAALPAPKV